MDSVLRAESPPHRGLRTVQADAPLRAHVHLDLTLVDSANESVDKKCSFPIRFPSLNSSFRILSSKAMSSTKSMQSDSNSSLDETPPTPPTAKIQLHRKVKPGDRMGMVPECIYCGWNICFGVFLLFTTAFLELVTPTGSGGNSSFPDRETSQPSSLNVSPLFT